MKLLNQLRLIDVFKLSSLTIANLNRTQRSLIHLGWSPRSSTGKDLIKQESPKGEKKEESSKTSQNNQNEANKNRNFTRPERTPLQRLLRVKDYADWIFAAFLFAGLYIWYKKNKEKKQNEIKYDIEWVNVPNFNYKIFTCSGFYFPEFVLKQLNKFKEFKPRKEDIWIVSFPKSGTTWVQELVYLMMNNFNYDKAKAASIENRSPFFEYLSPGLKQIEKMSSPRIIKTHLPYQFLPDNLENESKVIYILRNPKDVSVSYYHFTKLSTEPNYKGGFKDFAKLFLDGTVPYGPWWKHVDGYVNKKKVHIIHYEDLHQKPFEVIQKLSEFLGIKLTDAQKKSLIEWCSFENMEKNPSVNYEWYKTLGLFKKNGKFFRKGKVGDWLNHYSKDDSIALDKKLQENLIFKHTFDYGISNEDLNKIYSS